MTLNLIQDGAGGVARTFGMQRRQPAVNVIVACTTTGELEVTQFKRKRCKKSQ